MFSDCVLFCPGTVSVPTNRSSTGNRPNQPIISEQLPQPGEMVVIKGLCACCSHDVKSNQPRFLDGQVSLCVWGGVYMRACINV